MIGSQFNLLPLLLTVAMFLQMKFTPQMSAAIPAASTEKAKQQQMQQKMMRYMMPVMMLFFFYHAPSGLTLYIMTSTAATVCEQFLIRRHIRAREAAEAAAETMVAMPGRAAWTSRPKKPKGPNWTKHG